MLKKENYPATTNNSLSNPISNTLKVRFVEYFDEFR